jgi:hypothetical protein
VVRVGFCCSVAARAAICHVSPSRLSASEFVRKFPPSSLLQRGFLLPSAHVVAPHLLPKDGVERFLPFWLVALLHSLKRVSMSG